MATYIKLRADIDPGLGNEFNAAMYPGPGIYYLQRNQMTAWVHNGMVMTAYGPPPAGDEMENSGGMTPDDVVKLMAVALHSAAAVEAVK